MCPCFITTISKEENKNHTIQATYSNENLIFPTSLDLKNIGEQVRETGIQINYIDGVQLYNHMNLWIYKELWATPDSSKCRP